MTRPRDVLRHHVTGAVERGEKVAIVERPAFEASAGGSVTITGKGIPLYRLLVLRSAVKLEAIGLKRRGPSASSIVKAELGLGRCAKPAAVLAALAVAIRDAEREAGIAEICALAPLPRPEPEVLVLSGRMVELKIGEDGKVPDPE